MNGKPVRNGETNTAVVVALSATIAALVIKGDGPLSFGRLLARALSDPVARQVALRSRAPLPERASRVAA